MNVSSNIANGTAAALINDHRILYTSRIIEDLLQQITKHHFLLDCIAHL